MDPSTKMTPMMEQWHHCKAQANGAVLLFRMGDFYEAFYEDAQILAKELELTLTKRQGIPMSGVPWHTGEIYIDRLVDKGFRVAIAEQIEDPKEAKGLVRREIMRYITPGTVIHSTLLGEKSHNFIGSLTQVGSIFGLAICDITTATFRVVEIEEVQEVIDELFRLNLSELLLSKKFQERHALLLHEFKEIPLSLLEEWQFDHETACRYLTEHFKVLHLDGYGLKGKVAAINAAGALLAYLSDSLSLPIAHIQSLSTYSTHEGLLMDKTCQLNLELTETTFKSANSSTLLQIIDSTLTPMGGRLLAEWLKRPLTCTEEIKRRQDSIQAFLQSIPLFYELPTHLKEIRDLERLLIKIISGYATPRDLSLFAHSISQIGPVKALLKTCDDDLLKEGYHKLTELPELVQELKKALVDEPPARLSEGGVFRAGFHPKLDELRLLMQGGKEWLIQYQTQIKEETGIKNLKVSFNKIFGYYIEVSKGQAHLVPSSFDRRQTLVNCERFISPQLKEYETKVLSAEEEALNLEQSLFQALKERIILHEKSLFQTAQVLAQIDSLLSLAKVAKEKNYTRPLVDKSFCLKIKEGRHPVIETKGKKETFIANDIDLDGLGNRMMIITGPNMGGKSTYIRQIALIVILAQIGSFVPAKEAHIGLIDRIFTRIGASDDLARGQSTFMVEMSEAATILNHLTPRSLVILDEIGRGTSTYDGLSIAWSIAEYLLQHKVKALFATHYWELTELESKMAGASNYHAAVREWNEEIIFLHQITKGAADRSYGIHVAKLAGLPASVIHRASSLLKKFEKRKNVPLRENKESTEIQLSLF